MMPSTDNAIERICGRIQTLSDLHARGIVHGSLLKKQIKSVLASKDARKVFMDRVEPDRRAIKILNRLEDPSGWRELSMKSKDLREEHFYRAIEDIMATPDAGAAKLLRMLQLGCLPFYSGFLPFNTARQDEPREVRPSRVSVLD